MRPWTFWTLAAILVSGAAAFPAPAAPAATPVAANGRLSVLGTHIVNERGEPVQLRGFASHGMQWFNSFYADGKVFEAAADLWGADVLRLTIYLSEDGYLTSKTIGKEQFDAWIDAYVKLAARKGVYIILDWHVHKPGWPGYYLKEAKEFFAKMSLKYGGMPHVLWEIANEPSEASLTAEQSGGTGTDPGHYVDWPEIVKYANEVIPVIRANSPKSIILVGTPSWSTLGVSTRGAEAWKAVADNRLADPDVVYVIHYYAAGHTFQAALEKASEKLPLFATEWASSSFQETSALDEAKGKAFVDMLARRKIGWAYWNLSNNTPGVFAAFDRTTTAAGPFAPTGSNVTPTGKAVYKWLNEPADSWAGAVGLAFDGGLPARQQGSQPILRIDVREGRPVLGFKEPAGSAWRAVDGRIRRASIRAPLQDDVREGPFQP